MFLECFRPKFLKELPYPFRLFYHPCTSNQPVIPVRFIIRKSVRLFDIDNCVNPEPGQPFVQPPINHIEQVFPHFFILPVQVRLFFGKQMQIIQIRSRYRFPCTASEIRTVITRRLSVLAFFKIEISAILPFRVCQCLLEPFVLIRAMIDDQVHQYVHISFFGFFQQFIKIFHRAECRIYFIIIGNVISLVHKRGLINRGYPYNVHP